MLVENYQQLYHTFLEFYIYHENILTNRFIRKNFITQLLSHISIRNRIKYMWTNIHSFITHFLSLKVWQIY